MIHEELTKILTKKIISEKRELEKRLKKLNLAKTIEERPREKNLASNTHLVPRRKYPKVLAKYCNPLAQLETWSGRGKKPRWLVTALKAGHKLQEFKIPNAENETDLSLSISSNKD